MKVNNESAKKLKEDFPLFSSNKNLVYLDNASTTQKPISVIGAMERFSKEENANIHRGLYDLSINATKKYEEAHKVVTEFINANKDEIIFTKNTTESLNLLAYTIDSLISDIKEKNEIVLTEMEHHSNFVPWQQLAKKLGMKLKFIKIKEDFTLDYEDAKEKITDKTAILSVSHVSNVLGTINDIDLLIKLGKEKGAITIIDAAQSVSRIKIDVKELNCDFFVFSGHKMLGPMGIGVLYGKKELLERLRPFNFGGGMIKKVTLNKTEWNELPMKFEAGTQNVPGAIGLVESINYINKIGLENIFNWEKELTKYALEKLKEISRIEVYHPGIEKGIGVISFNLLNVHPHDISSLMNDFKIAIRGGHHCAMPLMDSLKVGSGTSRISFQLYNSFEDIDKFIESLKNIMEKFK